MPDASDSTDAPLVNERVRAAVAEAVRALALPGIAGVYEQFGPESSQATLPCVHVTTDGLAETEGANGTNEQDEVGFPVRLTVAAVLGSPPDQRLIDRYGRWRRALDWAFRGRPLEGVPESTVCEVEAEPPGSDPREYQHYASSIVVRCYCRVPRHTLV